MNSFNFVCTVCQGKDEPCTLTVKLKGDKITVPKLCPFNSGEPEWKILSNKTDQQKLKSLLKNFGVEFVENNLL